jgi:hypothetical protein
LNPTKEERKEKKEGTEGGWKKKRKEKKCSDWLSSFLGPSEIMCILPIAFSLPKSTHLSHTSFSYLERNAIYLKCFLKQNICIFESVF